MATQLAEKMKAKYTELITQYAKNRTGHALLREYWVNIMIKKVEMAKEILREKGNLPKFAKTTLENYDVLTIDNKPTLVKKEKENKIGKGRMPKVIVPVEHTFEIVLNAHLCTGHGNSTAMYNWIEERNYVIAPMCTPVLREVCLQINKECPTGKVKGLRTVPLKENKRPPSPDIDTNKIACTKNTISVTILDMTSQPDNSFQCLLIYRDSETKFIQLRPMIGTNLVQEIAGELLKIFCDFSPPTAITVEMEMENIFAAVLEKIDKVFPNKITLMVSKMIKFLPEIESKLKYWMTTKNSTNWSVGCHYVQWEMNRNLKSKERSAFDKFFGINKMEDTTVQKRRKIVKVRENNVKPSELGQNHNVQLNDNCHDKSKATTEDVIQINPVNIHSKVGSENPSVVINTDDIQESSNVTITHDRNITLASSDNQTPTTSNTINATNINDSANVRKSTTTKVKRSTKSRHKYKDFDHFMTLISVQKAIRKQKDTIDTDKSMIMDTSEKETIYFCCTCELAIETSVYFCNKCQKSLHEFCGVTMQSSNDVTENVCFTCL